MHWGYRTFLSACLGLLSATAAQPTFGQGAPNQSTFEQKLRPIPQSLQGGHQGLPTLGAPARPEPSSSYRPASTSERTPAASARSGGQHASAPAARPKAASAAALPGCPALSEAEKAEKPMVGFKVEFEFGSAQLKPASISVLRELGKALNNGLSDQKLFEIEGHTDAVGTFAYNEQLSQARAEAVKEFLIKEMSVAPERLKVAGRAFCEPANPGNPYAAENRRVVVVNQSS
jgi:OmpA-OmpF porin, OOP family